MDLSEILTDDTTPAPETSGPVGMSVSDRVAAMNKQAEEGGVLGGIKNIITGGSPMYLGNAGDMYPTKEGVGPFGDLYHKTVGIPAAVGLGAGLGGAAVEAALPAVEAFPGALQAGGRLIAKTLGQGGGSLAARELTGDENPVRNAALDTAIMGGLNAVFPFASGMYGAFKGQTPEIGSWASNTASRLFGKTTGLAPAVTGQPIKESAVSTVTKALMPSETELNPAQIADAQKVVAEAESLGAFDALPRNPKGNVDTLTALQNEVSNKLGVHELTTKTNQAGAEKLLSLKESGELGQRLGSSAATLGAHPEGQVKLFPMWDAVTKAGEEAAARLPATETQAITKSVADWKAATMDRLTQENPALAKVFGEYTDVKSRLELAKAKAAELGNMTQDQVTGAWIGDHAGLAAANNEVKTLQAEFDALSKEYNGASVPFQVMADEVHKLGQLVSRKNWQGITQTMGEQEARKTIHDAVSVKLQDMAGTLAKAAPETAVGKAAKDYIDATYEWGVWSKLRSLVGGIPEKEAISLRGTKIANPSGSNKLVSGGGGFLDKVGNVASRLFTPRSQSEETLRQGLRELDAANLFAAPKTPQAPGISKTAVMAAAADDLLPPTPSKLQRKPGTVRGMAPQILSTIPPEEQQSFMGAVKDSDENLSRYMLDLFQRYPQIESQFEDDKGKVKSFGGVINPQDQGIAFNDVVTGIFNNPTKNRSTDAYWKTRKIIQGSAIG